MSNNKFPRCGECGGTVELQAKTGRTREYKRGVFLPIPNNFEIPTCIACGEEYMSIEFSEPLDDLLGQLYKIKN